MEALDPQLHRLAAVHVGNFAEFKMDDSTQQLLEALEQRVRLQLKPIEDRQEEILDELKSRRDQMQTIQTQSALFKDHIDRNQQDLDRGLSSIRRDFAKSISDLEDKICDSNKRYAPMFAAIPGIVALLLGIFVYWIRS